MKTALFYEANKPFKLEERPIPEISNTEVLIRVRRCNICHTDIAIWKGSYPPRKKPPIILGHEIAGEVVEVGKEVKAFKRGDRVAVSPLISCGKCFYCRSGMDNLCDNSKTLGIDVDGGFREFINLPVENIFKFSSSVSYREAAFLEPLSVCYNAINKARIQSGDLVTLVGIGCLGIISLQILTRLKRVDVIAVDIDLSLIHI